MHPPTPHWQVPQLGHQPALSLHPTPRQAIRRPRISPVMEPNKCSSESNYPSRPRLMISAAQCKACKGKFHSCGSEGYNFMEGRCQGKNIFQVCSKQGALYRLSGGWQSAGTAS